MKIQNSKIYEMQLKQCFRGKFIALKVNVLVCQSYHNKVVQIEWFRLHLLSHSYEG